MLLTRFYLEEYIREAKMSSEMVVLSHNQNRGVWLDESIYDAYTAWASVAFKCLTGDGLFEEVSQTLCLRLVVVGVEDELSYDFIQGMMTQFCVANWPQFTTISNEFIKQGKRLAVGDFLKQHAPKLKVISTSLLLLGDSKNKKRRVGENCIQNAYKKVISLETSDR